MSSTNNFPLDEWGGFPTYFQPTSGTFHDGTITRFEVDALNEIVGFEDFENTQFLFGVMPNPTAKSISISNPDLLSSALKYAIYDLNGKKLIVGTFQSEEEKNTDVSMLSQRVYIINVSNGVRTYNCKFVKSDD